MSVYSAFTDQKLIAFLKQGEAAAFDELYRRYHQAIYKNILKLTKDRVAAEDILQDVFSVLWNKRDTLKENQPPANWLFTVSFNHSINFTKRKLREAVYISTLLADDIAETDVLDNDDDAHYKLLQLALQKLSPQKRRVFELCKLEGKTYEETALEMNISKHTVKEYLSAAAEFVKKFIKDNPGYSETALFIVLSGYIS